MKEEKFKVIQFVKEFIIDIEKELENFPKKDIEIKSKIRNNSFELLEILYEANTIIGENRPKKELLEKAIAKIKIIDFLINLRYDRKLITSKKYIRFGEKLDNIIRYIVGWAKTFKDIV